MQNLNCNQVVTLLTFYIEGKLSHKLSANLEYHLSVCKECREKYIKLKKILDNFNEIKKQIASNDDIDEGGYKTPQYDIFKQNLSAYVDNELSDEENIKIKKIAIANPLARKDLESIYTFRQLLQSSFEKTKNSMKQDFTDKTLATIEIHPVSSNDEHFNKIVAIFACIMGVILVGILSFLNF